VTEPRSKLLTIDEPLATQSARANLITYEEAAARLAVKVGTLRVMVSRKQVPHVRLGKRMAQQRDDHRADLRAPDSVGLRGGLSTRAVSDADDRSAYPAHRHHVTEVRACIRRTHWYS
jgi:excisionase family DNA binding protein